LEKGFIKSVSRYTSRYFYPEVFRDANQLWQQVISTGEAILDQALQAIATQINLPNPPHTQAKPFLVFNSLNWERTQVISLAIDLQIAQFMT